MIESIKEIMPYIKLHANIIGNGDHYKELRDLVKNYNLHESIHFEGFCCDVKPFFDTASLLVCPSLWNEAFGLVIIEAMASHVPVIASNCGGIPEIITHEETGLLVPPGDVAALSQSIYMIFNDSILRKNIVNNAYENVNDKFNINLMTKKYVKLYE